MKTDFFSFSNPHVEYSNRFCPFTRKRKNDANSINISISPEQNFHSGTVFKNLCLWCPKTDQNSVYAWTEGLTGFKNILIHVDRTLCPATRTRIFPNPQHFPPGFKNFHVLNRIRPSTRIRHVSGFTLVPRTPVET